MSNKIELLHPDLQVKARQLIALAMEHGFIIQLSQTLRTKAEQDAIYAQGRTTPGKIVSNAPYPQSLHCWGVAFDIVILDANGKATWDTAFYKKVGPLGISLGLEWGGTWTDFPDYPHYQLSGYKWSQLQKKYGNPSNFVQSWSNAPAAPSTSAPVGFTTVKVKIGSGMVQGIIIDGHTYAQVSVIAQALGRQANWDGNKRVVLIPPVTIQVTVDNAAPVRVATGNRIIPGRMINNHAYALVTDLAQALGHTAEWDALSKTVIVK